MSDGRTLWYPQDARWLSWDAVIDLGEEFGPAAVAVLVQITSEAKLQGSSWRVKVGLRTIARDSFVNDVDLVRSIVVRAGEAGLLDDVEFDDRTVTCRVSGMAKTERKARDAARKAADRAGSAKHAGETPAADGADTCGHVRTEVDGSDALSRETGEERRGEDNDSPDGESSVAPPDDAVRLANLLSLSIRDWTHTPPGSGKHQATAKWAVAIDRMHRLDGRSWQQIENAIAWLHAGKGAASFWQANILSADTLRSKFDQMALQARRDEPPGREGVSDIDDWLKGRAA